MKNNGMLFCKEDNVVGYLGVHINCCEDKTVHLTQRSLAQYIIEALHLTDPTVYPVNTPCTKHLPIDEDNPPAYKELNYPSIVG